MMNESELPGDGPWTIPALIDLMHYFADPVDEHDEAHLDFEWQLFEQHALYVIRDDMITQSSRLWCLISWAVNTLPVSAISAYLR